MLDSLWGDLLTPDERENVKRGRLDRGTGGTALLMVDLFAQAFGSGPLSCEPTATEATGPISRLLAHAREIGLPVVHTTGEDRPEARPREATTMLDAGRSAEELRENYAFHPPFLPRRGEPVVYKSAASAFFETRLRTVLKGLDVQRLVVVGESTSGCVRATVVDAFSCGFEVIVPYDAVFDRSPTSHRINLFDIHMKYGTVASTCDLLAMWSGKAPT